MNLADENVLAAQGIVGAIAQVAGLKIGASPR
jgi:hypothetical protein